MDEIRGRHRKCGSDRLKRINHRRERSCARGAAFRVTGMAQDGGIAAETSFTRGGVGIAPSFTVA